MILLDGHFNLSDLKYSQMNTWLFLFSLLKTRLLDVITTCHKLIISHVK